MKNLFLNKKPKLGWRAKVAMAVVVLVFFLAGVFSAARAVNSFFEVHYLQFNRVVEVVLKRPFEVRERELVSPVVNYIIDYPDEIDTPLEEYICEKFGPYECKPALAVASAESGLREDAYGVNGNGTIDIGIFQVNEVHWGKPGCSPKELFDAEANVDCAYMIWEDQGWGPWVAWQNKNYLNHLE